MRILVRSAEKQLALLAVRQIIRALRSAGNNPLKLDVVLDERKRLKDGANIIYMEMTHTLVNVTTFITGDVVYNESPRALITAVQHLFTRAGVQNIRLTNFT